MNWIAFGVSAWVMLGLELGLRDLFRLGSSGAGEGVAPSFVLAHLAFIAMYASPSVVHWSSLILGLLLDLTFPVELRDGAGVCVVIGPYSLGCLLGGQLVVTMRGLMMRRNPLTLAFLAVLASLVTNVTVVAFHTVRGMLGSEALWSPTTELVSRLGGSLYTGVLALVLSLLLFPLSPLMGFETVQGRRFAARRS
jgi:hypothetical protein